MTEAEFFERFDRHLERNSAVLERVEREVAHTREEVQRSREAHEDLRTFMRDITTRNEKVWREVMTGLVEVRKGLRESLTDMNDAVRANTAAVLKMLDRLEGNGAGA